MYLTAFSSRDDNWRIGTTTGNVVCARHICNSKHLQSALYKIKLFAHFADIHITRSFLLGDLHSSITFHRIQFFSLSNVPCRSFNKDPASQLNSVYILREIYRKGISLCFWHSFHRKLWFLIFSFLSRFLFLFFSLFFVSALVLSCTNTCGRPLCHLYSFARSIMLSWFKRSRL